jgi:hypothetical protein
METILFIAALIMLYFLFFNKKKSSTKSNKNSNFKRTDKISKSLIKPILRGYQIFFQNMSVVGINFHIDTASKFVEDSNLTIKLEVEPNNVADKNAIKVIGEGTKGDYFLGYVPKEVALKIVNTNCLPYIYARLIKVYRSERNYVDITFQIIGLKEKKEQFDSFEKNLPINSYQKEYLKFWKISYDKEITTSIAQKLIDDHSNIAINHDSERMIEWQKLEFIRDSYEEFSDKDEREQFDVKKPTKKQIESAVDALLIEGITIESMEDDYDLLVDKLNDMFPQL